MLETEKGRSSWVRCPRCGHKLFKSLVEPSTFMLQPSKGHEDFQLAGDEVVIETKCHSCKMILEVWLR